MKYPKLFIALSFIALSSTTFAASKTAAKPADLKHIDQQIKKLQNEIHNDQGKKGQLAQQLKKDSARLAKLKQKQTKLKKELHKQQVVLSDLQKKELTYNQKVTEEKALVAQQLLTTYKLYRANKDEQTGEINKVIGYCHYLQNTELADIDRVHNTLTALDSKQHETAHHQVAIQSSLSKQQKSQQELAVTTQSQQHALTQLDTRINSKNATLKQLIANRKALDQLIKKLQREQKQQQSKLASNKGKRSSGDVARVTEGNPGLEPGNISKNQAPSSPVASTPVASTPVASTPVLRGVPFTQLQGKLPWPTNGSITARFGSAIGQSGLKYTGILIKGVQGQEVHAVSQGKVVFANWLQGLGLLIIIDHNNGYLSLYGHNQALYKKTGDIVKAKDLIATIGKNSDHDLSELYFEIRHNGQPVNPVGWLS